MKEDWREEWNVFHAIIVVAVGSLPFWWLALTGRYFALGFVFVLAAATTVAVDNWYDEEPEVPQFTDEQLQRLLND